MLAHSNDNTIEIWSSRITELLQIEVQFIIVVVISSYMLKDGIKLIFLKQYEIIHLYFKEILWRVWF